MDNKISQLKGLLKEERSKILNGNYKEDILIPAKFREIETNPAHHRAALEAKRLGYQFLPEDSYRWGYVIPSKNYNCDVIAIPPDEKIPSNVNLNNEKMCER